jgi:hypothetical protein
VIPAFCKRGDIIVADRGVNFIIQKGLQISRSTVRWYDHNDLNSLESVLQAVDKEMKKKRTPLTRRFIVTEGIFENDGAMIDLPKLVSSVIRLIAFSLTLFPSSSSSRSISTASSSMNPTRSASSVVLAAVLQSCTMSPPPPSTCWSVPWQMDSAHQEDSAQARRSSLTTSASMVPPSSSLLLCPLSLLSARAWPSES